MPQMQQPHICCICVLLSATHLYSPEVRHKFLFINIIVIAIVFIFSSAFYMFLMSLQLSQLSYQVCVFPYWVRISCCLNMIYKIFMFFFFLFCFLSEHFRCFITVFLIIFLFIVSTQQQQPNIFFNLSFVLIFLFFFFIDQEIVGKKFCFSFFFTKNNRQKYCNSFVSVSV